jgi:F-type H+-transporting ATPase subunit a
MLECLTPLLDPGSALLPTLAASNPVAHVTDKPILGQWYISNVTVMLLIGAFVTAAIVIPAAQRISTGKRGTIDDLKAHGPLANLVEAVCLYLREDVFRPMLGEQTDRHIPLLWTLFWFILVSNLLGLLPILDLTALFAVHWGVNDGHGIWGTATQSIWVTGALAVVAFIYWNGVALVKDPKGWVIHLTAGAPVYMWPIMIPVEIIGTFVKPFALALRLFANMTGGHIILAVLYGFVATLVQYFSGQGLQGVGWTLAIFPMLGAVAVNILEILVAFIQAFIFAFLTGLFLSQLIVHEHEEEHEEHEGHHPEDQGLHEPIGESLQETLVPAEAQPATG